MHIPTQFVRPELLELIIADLQDQMQELAKIAHLERVRGLGELNMTICDLMALLPRAKEGE